MDKATFRKHLEYATVMLVDFTKTLCYNTILDNYKYKITPNLRTVDKDDKHLTDSEIEVLHNWNKYENQLLTVEQIVNVLNHDNKVPIWIDMTIYETKQDFTIIDLYCSRRLRNDNELYHQGEIMPFHLKVATPPSPLRVEKEGKFDVNWKKNLDDRMQRKSVFAKLKKILHLIRK